MLFLMSLYQGNLFDLDSVFGPDDQVPASKRPISAFLPNGLERQKQRPKSAGGLLISWSRIRSALMPVFIILYTGKYYPHLFCISFSLVISRRI